MKRALVILLLLAACSNKRKVPEDLLPPEKMEVIIRDMIHVDGFIANAPGSDSVTRLPQTRYKLYQQVLQLHGTTKDKFKHSLQYYEQHPTLLRGVMDSLDATIRREIGDTVVQDNKRPLPM